MPLSPAASSSTLRKFSPPLLSITIRWTRPCAPPPLRSASRPVPCSSPSASRSADAKTRRRSLKPWPSSAASSASLASARPKPACNHSLEHGTTSTIGYSPRRTKGIASMTNSNSESPETPSQDARTPNFLRDIIAEDLSTKKFGDAVVQTRFPPEPNGYLHIGHAKAICLDFGLADEVGGRTNLRFDDTNPEKEEQEYVDSIMKDVRWLGFEWERLCYASDYFGQLYEWALQLIKAGNAYVDDLSADEIRQHRGTLTEPGKDSPFPVSYTHLRAH